MGWEQSPREREDHERKEELEEKLQKKQQQRGLVMVEQRDIGGCPGVSGETRLQGRDPGTERTVVVQPQMLRDCGTWVKFPGVRPLGLPMAQIPVQTQEGSGWLVVGVLQDIGWEALLGGDCLPMGQDPGPAPVTAEGLNSNPGNQLARMEMVSENSNDLAGRGEGLLGSGYLPTYNQPPGAEWEGEMLPAPLHTGEGAHTGSDAVTRAESSLPASTGTARAVLSTGGAETPAECGDTQAGQVSCQTGLPGPDVLLGSDYTAGRELPGTGLRGAVTPGPASGRGQVPLPAPAAESQTELQKDPSLEKLRELAGHSAANPLGEGCRDRVLQEKGFLYREWAPQGEVELGGIGRQLVVPQESTGFFPFELLDGRRVRGPLNLEREVRDMLALDGIQPFYSPWASPVGLIPKRDRMIWFYGGYQKLKAITVSDADPMPRPGEILDKLRGMENLALADTDNMCIFSQTWEEQVSQVKRGLGCLKEVGLTVKAGKCKGGWQRCCVWATKWEAAAQAQSWQRPRWGLLTKGARITDQSAGKRPNPSLKPRGTGVVKGVGCINVPTCGLQVPSSTPDLREGVRLDCPGVTHTKEWERCWGIHGNLGGFELPQVTGWSDLAQFGLEGGRDVTNWESS
ncbi:uncharacterized protein LOC127037332 [Gopherus flavomarginatus]|uniref:uncharacterized protein LOC127037332 n=1 Tax=Gopherus flavomarginatus TaxID=286002 RepID=UPI0021CBD7C5|nr:uncharacterized protein LOC127037332 [Gopherus flavomarginatus]XP_050784886.1 uncharacterized protein LOC127037332 [Gopherus flavomarginatus]XP_050784887.1 uncharacterized protein LOC127037332 [Gopherus flavomarginatus]